MFKHKAVQDLAFIIQSDCIYQDMDLSDYWHSNVTDYLYELDQDPSSLLSLIEAGKSHFLGSYFETLFSFAIRYLSSLKVIFEHKQLFEEGSTLGEVDMLVQDPQGNYHHFEIAVKFYLQNFEGDVAQITNQWVGPNKKDSFRKKYARAKHHQLTLLDSDSAQGILQEFGVVGRVNRHLLMFGCLYGNKETFTKAKSRTLNGQSIDPLINQDAIRGCWFYLDEVKQLAFDFMMARELKKLNWLSAFASEDGFFTSDFEEFLTNIQLVFEQDERPRHFLLSLKQEEKQQDIPCFIVPNNW